MCGAGLASGMLAPPPPPPLFFFYQHELISLPARITYPQRVPLPQHTYLHLNLTYSDGLHGYFSNKQTEVSTGVKTYDTTVHEVWKHVAWSKHVVKPWQYVEHPTGWMSFAWRSFDRHSNIYKQPSPTTMQWLLKPIYPACQYTALAILMACFWWYTPVNPCLTAISNNSRVLCVI